MEATNPSRASRPDKTKPGIFSDGSGRLRDSKGFFAQPTAAEVSHLAFEMLRDVRIDAQELRNRFANLLNRGSSLE